METASRPERQSLAGLSDGLRRVRVFTGMQSSGIGGRGGILRRQTADPAVGTADEEIRLNRLGTNGKEKKTTGREIKEQEEIMSDPGKEGSLENVIRRNAERAKTVEIDGQRVEEHSLSEQIAADLYLSKKALSKRKGTGIRWFKLKHSGS